MLDLPVEPSGYEPDQLTAQEVLRIRELLKVERSQNNDTGLHVMHAKHGEYGLRTSSILS